jgi:hypothetical protein
MATAIQNQPMSKEHFQKSREFLALTPRQRTWLTTLIDTQDIAQATRVAYGTKADAYEAMLTRKIESSPRVIAALNLFYGRSEKEVFLSELDRTIRRLSGAPRVAALQLKARLQFSRDSESPVEPGKESDPTSSAPARRYAVNELVEQAGHVGRVVAVDLEGRPTQIEEVR